MTTVIIQIGNTDNNLSQESWSIFVDTMRNMVNTRGQVHFDAGSPSDKPWQNHCIVVNIASYELEDLKTSITEIREHFDQKSAAVTVGDTVFI